MPASLQKFPTTARSTLTTNGPIQCPYRPQRYLLIWAEWNSVQDWIRLAEAAVRRSHRLHGDIDLAPTLKVLAKS